MTVHKVVNKIKSKIYCRKNNRIEFFIKSHDPDFHSCKETTRKYYDIENNEDFNDLCKKYNLPLNDLKSYNFRNAHFCMIADDQEYGCYGWYTLDMHTIPLTEIDRKLTIPKNVSVLFGFYTNPNRRRQGFYFDLLNNIIANNPKPYLLIYALDNNYASTGAIKKVGFKYIGKYNYKNYKNLKDRLKQI